MAIGIDGSNNFSMDTIQSAISPGMKNTEKALQQTLARMTDSSTPADLIEMQMKVSQWTMKVQLQSSMVKEIGDAMKGIIQKAG